MRLLRHTGIFVENLEKMKDFYSAAFNMTEAVHDIETGDYIANLYGMGGSRIQAELYKLVTNDGCMIELLKMNPEVDEDVHSDQVFYRGCAHIAFTVNDVDGLYDRLSKEGLEFNSSPLLSRDGKHKVCFCKDPEGNFLELVEEII